MITTSTFVIPGENFALSLSSSINHGILGFTSGNEKKK